MVRVDLTAGLLAVRVKAQRWGLPLDRESTCTNPGSLFGSRDHFHADTTAVCIDFIQGRMSCLECY